MLFIVLPSSTWDIFAGSLLSCPAPRCIHHNQHIWVNVTSKHQKAGAGNKARKVPPDRLAVAVYHHGVHASEGLGESLYNSKPMFTAYYIIIFTRCVLVSAQAAYVLSSREVGPGP